MDFTMFSTDLIELDIFFNLDHGMCFFFLNKEKVSDVIIVFKERFVQ